MGLSVVNLNRAWAFHPPCLSTAGTDTSDNEASLYVMLLTGAKAAFSMLLKKSGLKL